jgi:hypothetical protein
MDFLQRIWDATLGTLGVVFAVAFVAIWGLGGPAGAIWAAVNDDLLSVVLSIVIPLYGGYYTISQMLS